MFFKLLLIILEILFFMSIGIFSNYKKLEKINKKKIILLRITCIIPLLVLSIIQVFQNNFQQHSLFILISLILSILADIKLINNFKAGVLIFSLVHISNIFSILNINQIISFSFVLLIFFVLLILLTKSKIKNSTNIMIIIYAFIQIFAIYNYINFFNINTFIAKMMTIGGALFIICDIQIILEKILISKKIKYDETIFITINNLTYYSSLIFFVLSTF